MTSRAATSWASCRIARPSNSNQTAQDSAAWSPGRLARRCGVNGECVDPIGQFVGKRLIHHAVPLDAALAGEASGDQINAEMRLSSGPVAGMADVEMRLVLDAKALRR